MLNAKFTSPYLPLNPLPPTPCSSSSNLQRREVLGELENRADSLSRSLTECRDENVGLRREIASLREQNSFLRGMLSAAGRAIDLPPLLPTCTEGRYRGGGSGGGGGSTTTGAASAVIGAVGTALAVVSCVALSAAGFGGAGGVDGDRAGGMAGTNVRNRGEVGMGGGRRMLLAVDDYSLATEAEISTAGLSGGGFVLGSSELVYWASVAVVFAAVVAVLFVVARAAYRAAVRLARVERLRGGRVAKVLGASYRGFWLLRGGGGGGGSRKLM